MSPFRPSISKTTADKTATVRKTGNDNAQHVSPNRLTSGGKTIITGAQTNTQTASSSASLAQQNSQLSAQQHASQQALSSASNQNHGSQANAQRQSTNTPATVDTQVNNLKQLEQLDKQLAHVTKVQITRGNTSNAPSQAMQTQTNSDPSTQAANNQSTNQTTNPKSALQTPPQPAVSARPQVSVQGQDFDVKLNHEQAKQLNKAASVVLTQQQIKAITAEALKQTMASQQIAKEAQAGASSTTTTAKPIASQLIMLAQSVQLKMPQALSELAQQNGVSSAQLSNLASRPQGYPLPLSQISANTLQFADGPNIKLDSQPRIQSGEYLAKIAAQPQRLVLELTKVLGTVDVELTPKQAATTQLNGATNLVITKNEPGQLLAQLFKKLESIPLNQDNKAGTASNNANAANSSTKAANASIAQVTPQNQSDSKLANQAVKELQSTVKNPQAELTNNLNQLAAKATAKSNSSQTTAPILPTDKAGASNSNSANGNTDAAKNTAAPLTNGLSMASIKRMSAEVQTTQANQQTSAADKNILGNAKEGIVGPSYQAKTADSSPINVLAKALTKAGTLPSDNTQVATAKVNLATELLKLLPQIAPKPLTSLAEPQLLQAELHSLAALQVSHPSSATAPLVSGSAITTLFQLLLGVRAQNQNNKISTKLAAHIQKLQTAAVGKLAHASALMAGLEKAGTLDSLGQLSHSVSLYQQASSDPNQAPTWYFAMPYSINQKQEQFEGKFEQQKDDDDNKKGWRLQLKFNITQGSLIVIAHKRNALLDITVQGNNQQTLDKIVNFQDAFKQKISAIGFTTGQFKTEVKPIPPTLLPGDHFLVKTLA